MWKRVCFRVLVAVVGSALVLGVVAQTPRALAGENEDRKDDNFPTRACCLIGQVAFDICSGPTTHPANSLLCASLGMVSTLVCGPGTSCPGEPPRD